MNEPEFHPLMKPDLEILRAKVQAWREARAAQKRAASPPVSPAPLRGRSPRRATAWLDRLSYYDDWPGCGAAPSARLPDEETE